MTILSDHPIDEDIRLDDLEAASRLSSVFDILRHAETKCPLTVALYGDWGTGKTSAMRWLEDKLNRWNAFTPADRTVGQVLHPRVYPIWFDPWKYHTKEDVWRGIISEVILSLFRVGNLDRDNLLKRMKEASKKFGNFLGRSFLHALANIQITVDIPGAEAAASGEVFREIYQEYDKAAHPEKAYLNQFEDTLKEWVTSFLKEAKQATKSKDKSPAKNHPGERIALFIDDLDRCLPSVTLEVLEAIKLYLNIPQLIFICGLDRHVVDAIVGKHYDGHGLDKTKSLHYLNKIFQVEVDITPSAPQVTGYIGTILTDMDRQTGGYWSLMLGKYDPANKESAHYRIRQALQKLARHNPREIKRLLNSSILRGRAAADNQRLRDAHLNGWLKNPIDMDHLQLGEKGIATQRIPHLLFAQGVSTYLLQRSFALHLGQETAASLFHTEPFLHWITELSRLLVENPEITFETDGKEMPPGIPNDYDNLIKRRPNLAADKPLDLTCFENEEVFSLLRIPFSIAVSQSAPSLQHHSTRATAKFPADLLQLIASQVGKNISDEPVTQEDLQRIKSLYLRNLSSIDTALPSLKDCPNLTDLNLSASDISNAGLAHLAALKNLTSLDLRAANITDAGLHHLADLSRLTSLDLGSIQDIDNGLHHLTGLSQLTSLGLNHTRVSDDSLRSLARLSQLTHLDLSSTQVSDDGLFHLAGLSQLTSLRLSGTRVSNDGLLHLAELSQLTSLDLTNTQVSDEGLRHLARLSRLSSLRLEHTQVGNEGLRHLARLSQLTSLHLDSTQVSDDGLHHLAQLSQLTSLHLNNTQIGESLHQLTSLSQLTILYLRNTLVRNEDLQHIAKLSQLTRLCLDDTQIDDAGLHHLMGLKKLGKFLLHNTRVTTKGLEPLKQNLPQVMIRR